MSIFYIGLNTDVYNDAGVILGIKTYDTLENQLNISSIKNGSTKYNYNTQPTSDTTTALKNKSYIAYVFNRMNDGPIIKKETIMLNVGSLDHDLNTTGTATDDLYLKDGIHASSTHTNRLDTTYIRNNLYDFLQTGKFVLDNETLTSIDQFNIDAAAAVTRINPGTISFKIPRSTVSRSYKPKNG